MIVIYIAVGTTGTVIPTSYGYTGTSDICSYRPPRCAVSISNEFCEHFNSGSGDDAWLAELGRRQRLGIKAAQRRHSRPPAMKYYSKATAFKYYREPRRQMVDILNCVPATPL